MQSNQLAHWCHVTILQAILGTCNSDHEGDKNVVHPIETIILISNSLNKQGLVNPFQQSHNGPLDHVVDGASCLVQILHVNINGARRTLKNDIKVMQV